MKKCTNCNKLHASNKYLMCDRCREYNRMYKFELFKNNPWLKSLRNIRMRVNGGSGQHKTYKKKKIKNFLTEENLKMLWYRDKAFNMKYPSIDRINNDGHYSVENCRYLEWGENSRRQASENGRIGGLMNKGKKRNSLAGKPASSTL